MKKMLFVLCLFLAGNLFSQTQFPKDPYQITFIKNPQQKPDVQLQQLMRQQAPWQNFLAQHGQWSVEFDELNGMPRRAYGKSIPTSGANPEEMALHFISNELKDFNAQENVLVLNKVNTSNKYHYVTFHQTYNNLEVLWSEATVRLSLSGNVVLFGLSLYNDIDISTTPMLNAESAKLYAASGISITITGAEVNPDLKVLPIQGEGESAGYTYKLVYEVTVNTSDYENIPGHYYTLVDANNGTVYYRQNHVHACGAPVLDATAIVQDDVSENPQLPTTELRLPYIRVDVGSDTYYTDVAGNLTIPGLTEDTEAEVFLRGLYAKVFQDEGSELPSFETIISPGENTFSFPPSTNLSAISAYYYQNVVHDYMKVHWPDFEDLDFDQTINTDLNDVCNAYYDGTSTNFFSEGGGCPNTALFNDVVMHEYGHGINYDLYDWLGDFGGMGNRAFQEGYADIWGICNTSNPILGDGFQGAGTFVRRYDVEPKVYPEDLVGEPHADGEIIAGAWWDLAENLGGDVYAMSLLWHETLNATIDGSDGSEGELYRDVLLECLSADDDNADLSDGTPNDSAILEAFAEHGIILLANVYLTHDELAEPAVYEEPITIDANLEVDYEFYLGDVTMFWKQNTASSWETLTMTNISGSSYEGQIPAQPEGTIIEYYFQVNDIYGGIDAIQPVKSNFIDDRNLPYFLLVGYTLEATEDFDNTFGDWVVNPFGDDNSITGQWDVGEPVETADGSYINQTGVDHTDGSSNLCAFTGNAGEGDGLGTNDVDEGFTSLRSPQFDASSLIDPVFTYYRWYANDSPTSANPGNDVWQVFISNNGSDYIKVERTYIADNSWRRNAIRISDYVEPTSTVSLLFIAQDSLIPGFYLDGGSLVEAAIDDMMIWGKGMEVDTTQDTTGGNAIIEMENLISVMYPNPATDFITIYFNHTDEDIQLAVYNELGEMIRQEIISSASGNKYVLNCEGLSAGVYTINFKNEQGFTNKRLVITN